MEIRITEKTVGDELCEKVQNNKWDNSIGREQPISNEKCSSKDPDLLEKNDDECH